MQPLQIVLEHCYILGYSWLCGYDQILLHANIMVDKLPVLCIAVIWVAVFVTRKYVVVTHAGLWAQNFIHT